MASAVESRNTFGLKFVTCETSLKVENAQLLFKSNSSRNFQFDSVEFSSGADDKNGWCLNVRLGSGGVSVTISNKNCYEEATVAVSVLDSEDCKRNTKTVPDYKFYNQPNQNKTYCSSEIKITRCYIKDFITYQQLLEDPKLLPDGDLVVHCEVTTVQKYAGPDKSRKSIASCSKLQIPTDNLESDLEKLLHDGKFSDVIIEVDGKEIKAHKNILSSRSPVFAAMFESEMKETQQNRVVITDLDDEVVQEMLHFIYTGKAPKLNEIADRLLVAADKYALAALKAMCELELCETISLDTVRELMILADQHSAAHLNDRLGEFIEENLAAVVGRFTLTKQVFDRVFPNFDYNC